MKKHELNVRKTEKTMLQLMVSLLSYLPQHTVHTNWG